jgi:hypothetical protein
MQRDRQHAHKARKPISAGGRRLRGDQDVDARNEGDHHDDGLFAMQGVFELASKIRGRRSTTRTSTSHSPKAAQRAGIEHAKAKEGAAYLGRKPNYTRQQFTTTTRSASRIAKETALSRQTIYRIKDDPSGAEAGLAARGT